MASAQEGRGFNAYFPMPFRERFRMVITNSSPRMLSFYYQLDYTLPRELPADAGYLHASFRRENPTTMYRDFVTAEGFRGLGRFLGGAAAARPTTAAPGTG